MTTNLPPPSQDQSSAMPSAYNEFLAIHDTNKTGNLPRRSDTLPSPISGLDNAHGQEIAVITTHDTSQKGNGQSQATSHPASQSAPNLLPSETFGATITSLQWDAWGTRELPAEPSREETEYAPSPPEGSGNHIVQDEIKPSLSTAETIPPSTNSPSIRDRSIPSPNPEESTMHHPQFKAIIPSLADDTSRVSLLTANTADSPPDSRDPSISSKGSSVWTADSAISSSSLSHSAARDAPLLTAPLSSGYSIRRKPLGFIESHSSDPPSTSISLQ